MQASCREDACTDSDGGYSIFQAGAANKGDLIQRDFCTDGYEGVEFYCEGNQIVNASFTCPMNKQCVDGRCEE